MPAEEGEASINGEGEVNGEDAVMEDVGAAIGEDNAGDQDPVDVEAAVDELLAIRSEWDYDLGVAEEFFFIRILGGPWTMANRGVAADAAGGFARPGVGKDWCKSFAFPAQASFAFNRYGREGANQLAREYCRRGHFFLRLWLQSGTDFQFTQEHIDAYQEAAEWRSWVESVPPEHRWCRQRAGEIRLLAPKLGHAAGS